MVIHAYIIWRLFIHYMFKFILLSVSVSIKMSQNLADGAYDTVVQYWTGGGFELKLWI